jgi:polar amino acid transport system substrate-binding protein
MGALGAAMGLKVNVVNVPFASILAGLSAGKYDVGASAFTDTKAREKTVDFVDYFTAGEAFMTKSQGGTSISGLAGICGKSVAVESATVELMDAQTQDGKCKTAGKPSVKLLVFPDQNSANLALTSGHAQLDFADTPVIDYQIKKSSGLFKLTGIKFGFAPYGLAIPKQPGLAPAILAALKVIQANGAYAAVFAKWGLQAGELPASALKINGAIS